MKLRKFFINSETLFLLIITLVIFLYRFWLLKNFGFKYIDSDSSIMWLGTKDYAQGLFYEPRFYGQAYNSMLESLLAVPLFKLGMPLNFALPIITTLLALFPFFILSVCAYNKGLKATSVIILTIPLLLPIEYDLLSSLPRGFVTGIAIVSISFFSLFRTKSIISFIMLGLLGIIAYSLNPNSVLILIPCLLYLLLHNFKNKYFYLYSSLGIITGILIHFLIYRFYENNSNFIIHSYDLTFSFEYFIEGINHIDKFFNYVTPVFWKQGWIVLLLPFGISLYLFKKNHYKEAFTVFTIPFILLIPFITSKIHDGTDSVFFSYSRMFLAVPVLFAISLSFVKFKKGVLFYLIISLSFIFLFYKIYNLKESVAKNLNKNHLIGVIETEQLYKECQQISTIADIHQIDQVIIINHNLYDFYNYGCPACMEKFPKTIRPSYERRTWRLIEDENIAYSNVLIIDTERELNEEFLFISRLDQKPGFYILKNNKLPTMLLLEQLNFTVRKY